MEKELIKGKETISKGHSSFKTHRRKGFYIPLYVFLLISVFFINNACPAVRTASVSGTWENTATWGGNPVPLSADDVTINTGISVTINSSAVCASLNIIGSLLINSSYSLSIAGNFSNSGTFTAGPTTSLIFNGSSNSIVSGSGTYDVNTVVMNMATKTTELDIQSANFIAGINTENAFNFTFTRGTWKYNNTATLTNCHNNGTPTVLTIPYNVIIESDQGIMNLCFMGTTNNVILSGKLFINGGIVNVQTGQAVNSGYDFRYLVNGGTPQLYVSSGSLHVGGGFNAYSGSDYVDFHMTGGIMTVSDNGYGASITFLLQDVAGGITYMTGGTIIMQDACNATLPDIDMGGDNISSYTVTGGTVQFGNPSTQGGSTYFGIQAHPNQNYPNFTYEPGLAKSSYNFNIGVHLNMLSLSIGTNMTFDAKNGDITLMGYNGITTLNNNGTLIGGTGTWTFNGSTQKIAGSNAITFNNLNINSTVSTTLSTSISITGNLSVASGSMFDLNNYTSNRSTSGGTLTIAGTLRLNATSGGQTGSNFPTNYSTITLTGGTVDYSGNGQTVYNGVTYNNLTLSNSTGINTAGGNLTVNGAFITTAGGTLNMSTFTLGGTFSGGITNNGTIKTASTSTPIPTGKTWGGTIEYSVATGGQPIVSATSYNNLTLDNSSGVNTSSASLVVNGNLTTTLGGTLDLSTFALSGTLSSITNNGTIKTASTNVPPIPTGKTWGGKVDYSATAGGQTVPSGIYNDLQFDNTSGTNNSSGNITVNGVLNLVNAHSSCAGTCLNMVSPDILIMGANATTMGAGDVGGIVQRNTVLANISYTFGNQFTTLTFNATGTRPSSVSMQISLYSASGPAWKTDAVWRQYDIIQTGGSGSLVVMKLHYRDCGLGANTELKLNLFDYFSSTVNQRGRSSYNATNDWVSLSNIPVANFSSSFGVRQWTMGDDLNPSCTWTGTTSTDWNVTSNWSCSKVPTSSDVVIIPSVSTHNPTLAPTSFAYNITIESGGVLNDGSGCTLTLSGDAGAWMNNGTFNHGTSTVIFNGSYPTKAGIADFYNMTISSGTKLMAEDGTTVTISGTVTNNGTWDETTTDNTVVYDGASQTIIIPNGPVPGYRNLTLSGTGTKTIVSGTLDVLGNMIINSGVTYGGSTNNPALNIMGDFSNSGIFTQGSGLVTLNGSIAQAIGGSTTTAFNNITISNTSAPVSVNTNISINNSSSLTVGANSIFTPAAGVIISGSGTITGSGRIDVTRTAVTADFHSQYTITNKILDNLTVNYSGNGAQSLGNVSTDYGNLMISSNGSRTVTFAGGGTIGISGTFTPDFSTTSYVTTGSTINFKGAGTQTIPAFSYNNLTSSSSGSRTLSPTGTIGISGTFTPGSNSYTITGSTVSFNGSSSQNIPAFTFNNLSCNNSSGAVLTGNIITGGTLSLSNGALSIGAHLLTINGDVSLGSGTLTGGASSDITFGGSGASTILPAVTLQNLTINRANGIAMNGDVTTGGTLTLSNGSLFIQNHTLTLNGDLSVTSGSISGDCSSSSIVVSGAGSNLTLPNVSLKTLTLNRSNGISLGGNITICNILYMISGSVVNLNSYAFTYSSGATIEYDNAYTTTAKEWPLANGPYNAIINSTVNYNLDNRTLFLNLTINSGKILYINPMAGLKVNGTVTNNNATYTNLVIQSDINGTGNFIHNNANVPGTVHRYLRGSSTIKPYHYISSPINQAAFGSIWQTGDYNIYFYDETMDNVDLDIGWTRLLTGPLTNGQSYAVVCAASAGYKTLTFTGNLNVPLITKSVTYTNTAGPYGHGGLDPRGWNLIGNPYPCSLDVSQFLNDNSSNLNPVAAYLWDDNAGDIIRSQDYATRNLLGGTAATDGGMGTPNTKIGVAQGFFVKTISSPSDIVFNTIERNLNSSNQFFIPDVNEIKRIWLAIKGTDNKYNEILVGFTPLATSGYDPLYDAIKLKGNPEIALYSILDDKDLTIQGLPPVTSEVYVPLGLDLKTNGTYTFYIKAKENFIREHPYLEDLLLGKLIDLKKDTFYTFSSDAGSVKNRFVLKFSLDDPVGIDPNNNEQGKVIDIYSCQGQIFINNLQNEPVNGKIIIYNLLGKKIYEGALNGDCAQNRIKFNNAAGYYLVTLVTNKMTKTRKIFLSN